MQKTIQQIIVLGKYEDKLQIKNYHEITKKSTGKIYFKFKLYVILQKVLEIMIKVEALICKFIVDS